MSALEEGATTVSATAVWELRDEASPSSSLGWRRCLPATSSGRVPNIVGSGPPAAATWRGPTALSGGEKRESGRTFLCPHEIGPSMRFAAPILRRPIRRASCQRGRRRSSRICIRMTRTPKVVDDFLRDTRDRFPWADLVAEPKPLRDIASCSPTPPAVRRGIRLRPSRTGEAARAPAARVSSAPTPALASGLLGNGSDGPSGV
jgi:hypothetical protein